MSQKLYIFNPDHDLAIAHGTNHYVSPASALIFRHDATLLLSWIADKGDYILCSEPTTSERWDEIANQLHLPCNIVDNNTIAQCPITQIVPWGWNHNIVQQLQQKLPSPLLFPSSQTLHHWRQLSHRQWAGKALSFLQQHSSQPHLVPEAAQICTQITDIEDYLTQHKEIILKMPWSGSGRGLRHIYTTMTPHQKGWAQNSILKQGMVLAEPFRHVIQDFAMEFECKEKAHFIGYSLFYTHHGTYQKNILLNHTAIERFLSQFIDIEILIEYRELLLTFLNENFCPTYRGFVGADMFVFEENNCYYIHPVVELNVRMTMGLIAARFTEKYLTEDTSGTLRMRYLQEPNALYQEDRNLSQQYPLHIVNGKIISGYLSLTPILETTQYAIQVLIKNN